MSEPLVWLPFEPEELGDPPTGLRYEVVDPTERVPDSVGEVRFYVPPYAVGSRVAEVFGLEREPDEVSRQALRAFLNHRWTPASRATRPRWRR